MIENPIRLVRELKGAPLSIVIVLGLVQQRVTQEWLERSTGYTDKPVAQALAYLVEIGLVDHTSAGWQLSAGMQQLPLPLQQIDEAPEQSGQELSESENFSDSVAATAFNLLDLKDLSSSSSLSGESRKNSDSDAAWERAIVHEMLKREGIGDPKLTSLVGLRLKPEWVYAHIHKWHADHKPAGILICRLEQGDRIRFDPWLINRDIEQDFPDFFEDP